jgi:hypothetical protein
VSESFTAISFCEFSFSFGEVLVGLGISFGISFSVSFGVGLSF